MGRRAGDVLLLLSLFLPLLLLVADNVVAISRGSSRSTGRGSHAYESRQCRLNRISSSRPSRTIESEGGLTELWDETEDEFQCAGVAVMRNTIRPQSLCLPSFSPSPSLVYIQRGQGVIGLSLPGCPESFHSGGESEYARSRDSRRGERGESMEDCHHMAHRVRQGDVLAVPAGMVHWSYNDADDDLIVFAVTDLNSRFNQLDEIPRSFFLAGGEPQGEGRRRAGGIESSSILRALDPELMSQSFNVDMEVINKMQSKDERGLIVKVRKGGMRMITPSRREEREHSPRRSTTEDGDAANIGMEDVLCNKRMHHYIDDPHEADVYSGRAGRLNSVNMYKLPVLRFLGMSAESGNLRPNSMFSPHWTMNAHAVVYVTQGEGRVHMVDDRGRTVFDDGVEEGDVVVVPQNYASVQKAGDSGLQWVSFETSPAPMRNMISGRSSVFTGLPVDVISNSYGMSLGQARDLKMSRMHQTSLFPPTRSS